MPTTAASAPKNPFIDAQDNPIPLSLQSLLGADFAIAAVLISYGAVLGKVSPLQVYTSILLVDLVMRKKRE